MSTYAVSFDLKYNDTYQERYVSLMEAIRRCKKVWTETTAFALVDTEESLEAFERRLWLTKFNSATDKLLVINVSFDNAISRGAIADKKTLSELLPGIVHN